MPPSNCAIHGLQLPLLLLKLFLDSETKWPTFTPVNEQNDIVINLKICHGQTRHPRYACVGCHRRGYMSTSGCFFIEAKYAAEYPVVGFLFRKEEVSS